MSTKVVRVESDCIDIIRKYSPMGSLTDGIRIMDKMLTDRELKVLESRLTGTILPNTSWIPGANMEDGMTKEYWMRFKKEVDKVVVQYAGR